MGVIEWTVLSIAILITVILAGIAIWQLRKGDAVGRRLASALACLQRRNEESLERYLREREELRREMRSLMNTG